MRAGALKSTLIRVGALDGQRYEFPGAVWDLAGKLFSEPGVMDAHVQMIGRWSTLYQRFSDWRNLGYSAKG